MSTDPGAVERPVHTAFVVSVVPDLLSSRINFSTNRIVICIVPILFSVAIGWAMTRSYLSSTPLMPLTPKNLSVLTLLWAPTIYSVGRLVFTLMRRHGLVRARRMLVPGQVMRIERLGLVLRHQDHVEHLPWGQVAAVRGVRRWDTPGPELRVERVDGTHWAVPFSILDVLPGGIDGGLYAYSGGRLNLDMIVCDDVWSGEGN